MSLVKEVILKRRSVRLFNSKVIPTDLLKEIVQAGIYAPSGSNSQNQRFLVITDKKELIRVGNIRRLNSPKGQVDGGLIGSASAVVFVFADLASTSEKLEENNLWGFLASQNCAASLQNMALMATARRLASCWISCSPLMDGTRLLKSHSWKDIFGPYNIPGTWQVWGALVLGYPLSVDRFHFPQGDESHGGRIVSRQSLNHYVRGLD